MLIFHLQIHHLGKKTYAVGDDVGVAVEGALWVSVGALIAGQVPDDQSLISATRQEHVWAIQKVSIQFSKKLRASFALTSPLR